MASQLPITAEILRDIERTAFRPRPYPNVGCETQVQARRRGFLEVALIRVMRDGMLTAREVVGLCWNEVQQFPDGSYRLGPPRNRVIYRETAVALSRYYKLEQSRMSSRIFDICEKSVQRRIRSAVQAALHLSDKEIVEYGSFSPRLGMQQELMLAYSAHVPQRLRSSVALAVALAPQYIHTAA